MSQVNLLPPEIRERQTTRRRTRLVILGGTAALVLIALFFVLQVFQLSSANSELAAQQTQNNRLEAQIAALSQYADLKSQLQERQQLVQTVLANEFSWSSALLDVSRVIPDEAVLSGMSGEITAPTGTSTGAPTTVVGGPADAVGSITFQGSALDIRTVATWLEQLEKVKGWTQAKLANATEQSPSSNIYEFDTSITLTKDALKPSEATP